MKLKTNFIIVTLMVILVFYISSCTKENPLDPESDNTYTIEGVMYDQDGVTPLKNYPLNIGGGGDYDYNI